ncbi:MAG: ABC transporter substrate-binding protein [Chloroflexi bacterium]|nr:ABC transporter substrate-binding protein [Chloroflexota bacterium]
MRLHRTLVPYIILFIVIAMLAGILPPKTSAQSSFYNEAPMLTERVANGELPTVDERLPLVPLVISPVEQVGTYGGTLTVPVANIESTVRPSRFVGYESLVRWDPQWLRVIPNIAQTVDTSEDSTTYTFQLREGIRWSDGELFTADDIMFWYEAVLSNPELTPRPPNWLSTDGVPVAVEKINDLTVKFTFAQPNGLFLFELANSLGTAPTTHPSHYLQQFHPDYNPSVDELVAEHGVADWIELFGSMTDSSNLAKPTLGAWIVVERGETIVAERNPYYWKVDTDFNQLPYIDRLVFVEVGDIAAYEAAIADSDAHLAFSDEFATFAITDASVSDVREITLISSNSTSLVLGLNLTHPDPVIRAFFQNKDVRIALSHAINRQRIIDEVFGGEGEPYQLAPRPESPYFNERMAYQYTEFDLELANELLDQAGYAERDSEGFRVNGEGMRLTFQLQANAVPEAESVVIMQLVSEDWQAAGIDVTVDVFTNERTDEYNGLLFAGQHYNYSSEGVGGLDVILEPAYYFPVHPFASFYASGWGYWYRDSSSEQAVEPPAPVQQQMALYNELKTSHDPETQVNLMRQILEIAADEFLVIGTVLDPNGVMLISGNLHNVPLLIPQAFTYPTPAPTNPAQYYIDLQN